MNELTVIQQQEILGKPFTVYGDFENPLFLAKEVAEWIEHSNARVMLQTVDEEEKLCVNNPYALKGQKEQWFLTEDGVYEVLMQSRKPIAKQFKKEVKAVLKSIRKHGAYMTPETLEQVLLNPDTMIKLCMQLKEEQNKNGELQLKNAELTVNNQIMKPKADYFDELVDRNLLTNFRETAKQLQVKEKAFIKFLLDKKYIYKDKKGKIMPYADKNKGLFEVKETFNEKTNWSGTQTLITPKGRETFRLLCVSVV
ncbi:MAG: phage antirepressor KilAC domain-containing protein [Lachnospiraceae bacterium]|nr:phage antirepressor KilAC domain-containing protein [Lachnospiraceae bacterium]